MAGCSAGLPLSVSTWVSAGRDSIVEGTGGKGPLTEAGAGTGAREEIVVAGQTGGTAGGGITHGNLEDLSDLQSSGGGSIVKETSFPTPASAAAPTSTPAASITPTSTPAPTFTPTSTPTPTPTSKPANDQKPGTPSPTATESAKDGQADAEEPAKPTPDADKQDKQKVIALTFDDGPDARYTTEILDILKEKGVKATFFVVGTQAAKYPEIMKRIVDEGHAIGNHTNQHKDLSKLSEKGILDEITEADETINEAVGFTPTLFRAPYGAVSDTLKKVLKSMNRELIGWNVDTRDWAGTSVSDMRKMIRNEAKPGGIILMHSFGGKHIKNTVKALPGIIDDLEDMGYSLVTAGKKK
ncbi:polysaccharide deacetylase family protein [Paenibacillus sp. N4]|nr:polysaccharide deacetylase family protein [Paenibacillus vietnamensis]